MKKTLVFAIITLLIGVSIFSSVSSRYISISDIGKLNTNLLKKTHENQLIKIINNMKKKLDEVNTQREYNLIFKETLIEFDKLGLLGGKSVNKVYNFITNNGNAPYSIHGESSDTYIIENIGIYLYNHGFEFLYKLFLVKIKFRFHLNSWIS